MHSVGTVLEWVVQYTVPISHLNMGVWHPKSYLTAVSHKVTNFNLNNVVACL